MKIVYGTEPYRIDHEVRKLAENAYIVDLVNGMIRPEAVKPDGGSTDEELRVTTSIGVRPAFAVPQG